MYGPQGKRIILVILGLLWTVLKEKGRWKGRWTVIIEMAYWRITNKDYISYN